MQAQPSVIVPYHDRFKEQIVAIWERSVRATHHFLTPAEIDYYKSLVREIDFNLFHVYCSRSKDQLTGFIGVTDHKVEMLFIDPDYIGKGFGKLLLRFAIGELQATAVDVNEENDQAVGFYSRFGFTTYERMPLDGQGKEHPILKMKLNS